MSTSPLNSALIKLGAKFAVFVFAWAGVLRAIGYVFEFAGKHGVAVWALAALLLFASGVIAFKIVQWGFK